MVQFNDVGWMDGTVEGWTGKIRTILRVEVDKETNR
jgi:hypothetical protein